MMLQQLMPGPRGVEEVPAACDKHMCEVESAEMDCCFKHQLSVAAQDKSYTYR